MPATRRGVYHNLKETEYAASNGEAALFFSSKCYLNKFLEGYYEYRRQFKKRLQTLAPNNDINFDFFADIQFYKKVEKRGFRAWVKGVDITCHETDLYALREMTKKSSPVWLKMQRLKLGERLKIME